MPEETESIGNRVSLKVGEDLLDWIRDEQYRQRKITGKQLTYDEILRQFIPGFQDPSKKIFALPGASVHNLTLPEATRRYIAMLLAIFETNKPDAVRAVSENLQIFYKYSGCGDPEDVKPIELLPPTGGSSSGGGVVSSGDEKPHQSSRRNVPEEAAGDPRDRTKV